MKVDAQPRLRTWNPVRCVVLALAFSLLTVAGGIGVPVGATGADGEQTSGTGWPPSLPQSPGESETQMVTDEGAQPVASLSTGATSVSSSGELLHRLMRSDRSAGRGVLALAVTAGPDRASVVPADGSTVTSLTPWLSVAPVPVTSTVKLPTYLFEVYSDPGLSSRLFSSGWQYQTAVQLPSGVLRDGMLVWWRVRSSCNNPGWSTPATGCVSGFADGASSANFRVMQRLGTVSAAPSDSVGPLSVNLATGNLSTSVLGSTAKTAVGDLGVEFTYDSQAQQQGLTGRYFVNCAANSQTVPSGSWWSSAPVLVRTDPNVHFSQGATPDPSNENQVKPWWPLGSGGRGSLSNPSVVWAQDQPENFCVQWTGTISFPTAGVWCVAATVDDGYRVTIGSKQLVDSRPNYPPWPPDSWALHPWPLPTRPSSVEAARNTGYCLDPSSSLTAPIRVDYFQGPGGPSIGLHWTCLGTTCPDQNAQGWGVIPSSAFGRRILPTGWGMRIGTGSIRYQRAVITSRINSSGVREIDSVAVVGFDGGSDSYLPSGPQVPGMVFTGPPDITNVLRMGTEVGQSVLYLDTLEGTYVFNQFGLLVRIDRPDRASPRLGAVSDPGRLESVTDPASASAQVPSIMRFVYSPSNECKGAADLSTAPVNMLCRVVYWDGSATDLIYTSYRQIDRIINPGGAMTLFGFTGDRLTSMQDSAASGAASLMAAQDPRLPGLRFDVTYDGLGRVVRVTQPLSSGSSGGVRPLKEYSFGSQVWSDLSIVDTTFGGPSSVLVGDPAISSPSPGTWQVFWRSRMFGTSSTQLNVAVRTGAGGWQSGPVRPSSPVTLPEGARPRVLASPGESHVFWRGTDGVTANVSQICLDETGVVGRSGSVTCLSSLVSASAPNIVGDPVPVPSGNGNDDRTGGYVLYRGSDNQIYQNFWNWRVSPQPSFVAWCCGPAVAITSDPTGFRYVNQVGNPTSTLFTDFIGGTSSTLRSRDEQSSSSGSDRSISAAGNPVTVPFLYNVPDRYTFFRSPDQKLHAVWSNTWSGSTGSASERLSDTTIGGDDPSLPGVVSDPAASTDWTSRISVGWRGADSNIWLSSASSPGFWNLIRPYGASSAAPAVWGRPGTLGAAASDAQPAVGNDAVGRTAVAWRDAANRLVVAESVPGQTVTAVRQTGLTPMTDGSMRRVVIDGAGRSVSDTDAKGVATTNLWSQKGDRLLYTQSQNVATMFRYDDSTGLRTDVYGPASVDCFDLSVANAPSTRSCQQAPAHTALTYDTAGSSCSWCIGLRTRYYSGSDLSGPPSKFETVGSATTGTLQLATPADAGSGPWSAMLNGDIRLPASQGLSLKVTSSAALRISIDGTLLFERGSSFADQIVTCPPLASSSLCAEGWHRIRIEYRQTGSLPLGSTPSIQIIWSSGTNYFALSPESLRPRYDLVTSSRSEDSIPAVVGTDVVSSSNCSVFDLPWTRLAVEQRVASSDPSFCAASTALRSQSIYSVDAGAPVQLVRSTNPGNGQTTYAYATGGSTPVHSQCGQRSEPQRGLVRTQEGPQTAKGTSVTTETIYDGWGRVASEQRKGSDGSLTTCFSYDDRGRLKKLTRFEGGGSTPSEESSYDYTIDISGSVPLLIEEGSTTSSGKVTSRKDLLGRLLSHTDTWGTTTTYSYDDAGREVSRATVGAGSPLVTSYDSRNRVSKQSIGAAVLAAATYGVDGRLSAVSYGNGTSGQFSWDPAGRLRSVRWTRGSAVISSDEVIRSQSGLIVDESIDGKDARPTGPNYSYDFAGRLVSAYVPTGVGSSGRYQFGFDAGGGSGRCSASAGSNLNVITSSWKPLPGSASTSSTYCFDSSDRLLSTTDPKLTGIGYDGQGRTSSINSKVWFDSDVAGRTTCVEFADGSKVAYLYDAYGRIVLRSPDSCSESVGIGSSVTSGRISTPTPPDISFGMPAGAKRGDLLLAIIAVKQDNNVLTPSLPTGWRLLGTVQSAPGPASVKQYVFTWRVGSENPGPLDFITAKSGKVAGAITVLRDAAEVSIVSSKTGSTNSPMSDRAVPQAGSFLLTTFSAGASLAFTKVGGQQFARTDLAYGLINPDSPSVISGLSMLGVSQSRLPGESKISTGSRVAPWVSMLLRVSPRSSKAQRIGHTGNDQQLDSVLSPLGASNSVIELLGGVVATRGALNRYSYPNVRGDIVAVADGSGAKIGPTFSYGPYGDSYGDGSQRVPDNLPGDIDLAWLGKGRSLTDTKAGLVLIAGRSYLSGGQASVGRYLTEPTAGGTNSFVPERADPVNRLR